MRSRGVLLALPLLLAACAGPPGAQAEGPPGPAFAASPLYAEGAPWTGPEGASLRHAFVLSAHEPRFGGWSGIAVDETSTPPALVAVSDRGYWMRAPLEVSTGRPDAPRMGRLGGLDGTPLLENDRRDAEELVALGDGSALVSFERDHRLWLYPAGLRDGDAPFAGPPIALPAPPGLDDAPRNGGMEAVSLLPDGRLLVLIEGADGAVTAQGWLGRPDRPLAEAATAGTAPAIDWRPFRLALPEGFRPTAAANDDRHLYVLVRAFSTLFGFRNQLRRLPLVALDSPASDTPLGSDLLVRLSSPPAADNFEGLTLVRDTLTGDPVAYLISDDNYNGLQRTLWLGLGPFSQP